MPRSSRASPATGSRFTRDRPLFEQIEPRQLLSALVGLAQIPVGGIMQSHVASINTVNAEITGAKNLGLRLSKALALGIAQGPENEKYTYAASGQVVAINASASASSNVGSNTTKLWGDMDYNPVDGWLYGLTNLPKPSLVRVNPDTGKAAVLAEVPGADLLTAAAFDNDGRLYVLDVGQNSSDGQLMRIEFNSVGLNKWIDVLSTTHLNTTTLGWWVGMDFDPANNALYLADGGHATTSVPERPGTATLYTVNVRTGNLSSRGAFHDASGNREVTGLTFMTDMTPVSATIASKLSTLAAPTTKSYKFTVKYVDDCAVKTTSLDSYDIRVLGPNTSTLAGAYQLDNPYTGTPRNATYAIAPPGGSWDAADNGVYTLWLRPGQVRDVVGHPNYGQTLGKFTVNIPATTPLILNGAVARSAVPAFAKLFNSADPEFNWLN